MRIKVINPDYGVTPEQIEKREEYLQTVARNDTQISMEAMKSSLVEIDSEFDVIMAGKEIIHKAWQAEQQGFDAIVLYCLSDPCLNACREILSIPVLGGAQVATAVAATLGNSYSFITTAEDRIPEKRAFLAGLTSGGANLASVRAIEKDEGTHDDYYRLEQACKACIAKDKAEVIILGCMTFIWHSRKLKEELSVPIIDPALCCINFAEMLHNQALSHSKVSFPFPQKYTNDSLLPLFG